ncbi:type II toxin-antitoxin system Phd/YefM family antitoxin [Anabaena sphaerica FACHB-251]|uniref:Type II toxin-antitoxin system Phd/YefM family antitoxin n=1 Tax=Anabaena sphaerica FACHB-251 TaxID=2692883 RepID=A0A926WHX2_9NOST|nr:type II toxin-antitoxin system Phd/YefM family antitoxin [Anabaena sphaerica]MBD2294798.1 type II toxin-antitoxin system Phd/YefM family antitoxin [Anabaena sphaerica FACHB-251]
MLSSKAEGFIRIQTEVVKSKLLLIISDVLLEKQRIVLEKGEQEVAAIIPADEFERLEWLRYDIKYGQFQLDEEYDDENECGIPCINIQELEWNFEQILAQVMCSDEIFGLTFPTASFEDDNENFIPGAILMNINNFWIPDYWLNK